jgi:threonine aldolase
VMGKEAAIFVPTGSMGNLIAARLHMESGQQVICESRAHILDWEMGMVSTYAGCMPRSVVGERGVMTWSMIEPLIAPKIYYRAQTGLVWLENSLTLAGGTVTPMTVMEEIWAGAAEAGLPVHLDGARVFNAATALGIDVKDLVRGFATVMFCLSKGLGAPAGSMLVGSREIIARARGFRKALGGGMRQSGVLAAAGLVALEEMTGRLGEDHAHARMLAEAVAECPRASIDRKSVQTNMLIFSVDDAAEFTAALKQRGVLAGAVNATDVRLVTHFDVSREDCEQVAEILKQTL